MFNFKVSAPLLSRVREVSDPVFCGRYIYFASVPVIFPLDFGIFQTCVYFHSTLNTLRSTDNTLIYLDEQLVLIIIHNTNILPLDEGVRVV
jgi:hypothetical protein